MKAEKNQKRTWVGVETRRFEQKDAKVAKATASSTPQPHERPGRAARPLAAAARKGGSTQLTTGLRALPVHFNLCGLRELLFKLFSFPGRPQAVAAGVAVLLNASSVMAAGFFSETFEEYGVIPTNVAAIGNGWGASSNTVIVVTNEVTPLTNKVALIAPGEAMWNTVNTNVSPNWIWSDMKLNSTNFMTPDQLPGVGTSAVFMIAMATNGFLYLGNPTSGVWDVCSSDATNGPVSHPASTGEWVRVSVFQNYSNHTVAIYVGGVLIRTNWSFLNTNIATYGTLRFDGAANANVFVDEVTVSNATPPGLNSDINNNGMPDGMELTQYGSLNVWTGSTVMAIVTNLTGVGIVAPTGVVTGIKYDTGTNFFMSADKGCALDRVWTNGVLAATYDRQSKTNTFVWSHITTDGTFQVGFIYNGIRYVPTDYGSVTGALAVALTNDQIVVSNGTYAGSITLSNGVALIGTNMTGTAGDTNLTINGAMSVVQTGKVSFVGAQGLFTVTGQVSVAAGGVLTISNAAAIFGGLTIAGNGVVHVIDGALTVGGITKTGTFDVTLVAITASVLDAYGAISPTGTFSVITWYSNVTYTLTANEAYVPGTVTNNGVDVSSSLEPIDVHHWRYTDTVITNNRALTATFSPSGLRYVPTDYGTLTSAVASAQAGDTIVVSGGAYNESVTVASNLTFTGTVLTGLVSYTVQAGVTNTWQGFTNITVSSLTMATNGVLVISNSVLNLTTLTIQSNAYIRGYNSTAMVSGVEYTGDFTLDEFWNIALTAQPLNFSDGFETYDRGTHLDRLGNHGWWASTSAVTVVENPDSNNNAVSTNAAQVPFGQVVSNQVSASGVQKVWCDLLIRSTGQEDNQDLIDTNGASPVMFFVNSNNWLTVLTPSGWDVCSNDVWGGSAPPLPAGSWAEISCFMDFTPSAEKVSYFVNGRLVRQGVPFARSASCFNSMKVQADNAVVWFDNVNITTNLPGGVTNWPGSDSDHDGIPDALEIQLYGNTSYLPFGSVFKFR